MTKTYLRYSSRDAFGIIASATGNVLASGDGGLAIVPAIQNVLIWNLRTEVLVHKLVSIEGGPVTVLAKSPDGVHVAAGHEDGTIRVWDILKGKLVLELTGHRKSVTAIQYNADGSKFVSGSKDTDIVLWDVTSESGLFRLRGHTDMVTDLSFICDENFIVSASKDTLVKVWDLETQHCVQTVVGHRGEVWSLACDPSGRRIVTGSSDNQLRVWKIVSNVEVENRRKKLLASPISKNIIEQNGSEGESGVTNQVVTEDDISLEHRLQPAGALKRELGGRVSRVCFSEDGGMLGCLGTGKALEVYRVRNELECKKKMKRRYKRKLEKARKAEKAAKKDGSHATDAEIKIAENNVQAASISEIEMVAQPSDEFELTTVLRAKHKMSSFAFAIPSNSSHNNTQLSNVPILIAHSNNSLCLYNVKRKQGGNAASTKPYTKACTLELQGHRAGVRAIALSRDDSMVMTASKQTTKVWRTRYGGTGEDLNLQCIRTFDSGYGLCCSFVQGDRHAVVGTKEGELKLFSLGSGDCIFSTDAHEGSIWSLAMRPDKTGFATGSADKTVKFWEFDVDDDENLTIVHTRTLKMTDEVMCLKYSHAKEAEKLLIAIALLDCTVKVFYEDTLKFSLSLYGHKLPVMSLDISSDDSVIATASADKNVKLWGLDFGDCHKSIFAHSDSVMSVSFVRGTHFFFTTGKDGIVKYWDGDTYNLILEMKGHTESAWCSVVSQDGDFCLTGSEDKSIRCWERSKDQVFLEEEEELRMEEVFEAEMDDNTRNPEELAGVAGTAEASESAAAGVKSKESLKATERIMEALELADAEKLRLKDSPQSSANPLMLGMSPEVYVMRSLREVKSQDLEQALLVMPVFTVQNLFLYLAEFARLGLHPELTTRCICFLLTVHHNSIVANRSMLNVLRDMNIYLKTSLQSHKDSIGFNIAGLKLLRRRLQDSGRCIPDKKRALEENCHGKSQIKRQKS